MAAGPADPPAGEPPDEVLDRDLDQERLVDVPAGRGQRRVERLCLRAGSRKAVEDRAALGIVLPSRARNSRTITSSEHELTRAHDRVDLAADLAAAGDLGPEQVAGCEDGRAEARGKQRRLRALAGTRCAEKDGYGHRVADPQPGRRV